jgi:hypothetical protein
LSTDQSCDVLIEVMDREGRILASKTEQFYRDEARSRRLTEYFPELIGVELGAGIIRITASERLACFAFFAPWDLASMAAIPAQTVTLP